MIAKELTVEVGVSMTVSRDSAERALKVLEWYLNDHSSMNLMGRRLDDGRTEYYLEERQNVRSGEVEGMACHSEGMVETEQSRRP